VFPCRGLVAPCRGAPGSIRGLLFDVKRLTVHNQRVRRLVVAAMLVLFASLNAIDGICCPDGCTHEQASTSQHHDRESSGGSCVLCLGGIESAVPQAASGAGTVTIRFAPLLFTHHLDAPTDPPDHPPRS
jgi:hypothetical protein